MYTKQLLLVFATVLATVSATSTAADKRFVREPGMPILKMPAGTVALKRGEQPVMQVGKTPTLTHAKVEKGGSRPLQLTVTGSKFHQRRSMPLELDDETLSSMSKEEQSKYSRKRSMPLELPSSMYDSMPKEEQEKYQKRESVPLNSPFLTKPVPTYDQQRMGPYGTVMSDKSTSTEKRFVMEGSDGHYYYPKPVGSSKVTPMKRDQDKRYIIQGGPNGPIFPTSQSPSHVHPMKRADEMMVGIKQHQRPILP